MLYYEILVLRLMIFFLLRTTLIMYRYYRNMSHLPFSGDMYICVLFLLIVICIVGSWTTLTPLLVAIFFV